MEIQKNLNFKKKKFPIGIFMMLFVIETGLALTATAMYFKNVGEKRINEIEKYTKNYSMTMADAFTDVAELSYRARSYRSLKTLFRQEIRENTIDEAFFVRNNGDLVVHSSKKIETDLKGNIANDEFAYNIDLILRPSRKKLDSIQFTSYNVMNKKTPFSRNERIFLKKYLYNEINMMGWLISKAVYYKKRAVGTVNFIIYKDRINNFIKEHILETKNFYVTAQIIAFAISFFVTIVVLIRYRSIQEKTMQFSKKEIRGKQEVINLVHGRSGTAEVLSTNKAGDEEFITIDLIEEMDEDKFQIAMVDEGIKEGDIAPKEKQDLIIPVDYIDNRLPGSGQIIKDAIPLARKR